MNDRWQGLAINQATWFFLKLWLQTNQLVEQKKFLICKLSVNVQHWFAKQSFYQFQTSMRFGHWKGHQRLFFVFLKSIKISIVIWIARCEIFFLFSFPFTPRLIPHRQDFSAGSPENKNSLESKVFEGRHNEKMRSHI